MEGLTPASLTAACSAFIKLQATNMHPEIEIVDLDTQLRNIGEDHRIKTVSEGMRLFLLMQTTLILTDMAALEERIMTKISEK